jgi:hypothetical protein
MVLENPPFNSKLWTRLQTAVVALLLCLPHAAAHGAVASKLAFEGTVGPAILIQRYGQYGQRSPALLSSVAASWMLAPSFDLGLRLKLQTVFDTGGGIGSGADAVLRYFPFTYARMPRFESEPQRVQYHYVVMPYVMGALGVESSSFAVADGGRVLNTLPAASLGFGSFFPLIPSFALNLSVSASYGYVPKLGGEEAQQLGLLTSLGIIFFL